ncbi:hypothetical protein DP107_05910 [Haloglomus irregulare]|uniref:Phosphatidic acid phosphatase type 2/haloperoxidase domain-containing protein n=2 Tax=Haloglomus irregulare TaxID=2234134 RepID=A0A554NDB5_9EURY|nr:hypothetical protein DP107_05910 [Haloglomus irregulare]
MWCVTMAHDTRIDIEERELLVESERGRESVEQFVEELLTYENRSTERQGVTIEIDGRTYRPYLFTKGMPLDDGGSDTGTPRPEGVVAPYRKIQNYLDAVREAADPSVARVFERGGNRLFIGVPGVHSVSLAGMEAWRGVMPMAPDPTGPHTAAEMIDLYAMEQLRDVPFVEWRNEPGPDDGDTTTSERFDEVHGPLATDLDRIADEDGIEDDWWYGKDRLFVEADVGAAGWWGPYISQFLLHDVDLWSLPTEQRYLRYQEIDYNKSRDRWLELLEGIAPTDDEGDLISAELNPNPPSGGRGYIETPRHLATIVNAEPPYQEYLIAALYLLGRDWLDYDEGLAYVTREEGPVFNYTDNGPVGLLDLLARAGREALLAAFYQKYYAHFRCRPETYAGRIHGQEFTADSPTDFEIDSLVTDAKVLERQRQLRAGGDGDPGLLSTVYIEGSPVHPAYPSGHSVIAGACGTILKAWFKNADWNDEADYYLPVDRGEDSYPPTMDVPEGHRGIHQEIDKLMSNVGLARMFAGVHYYSDHYEGVKLGEQVAVGLLTDVFGRAFDGREAIAPTFTPYMEYGADAELAITEYPRTLRKLRYDADRDRPRLPS